jgi:hypothetical protein
MPAIIFKVTAACNGRLLATTPLQAYDAIGPRDAGDSESCAGRPGPRRRQAKSGLHPRRNLARRERERETREPEEGRGKGGGLGRAAITKP